MSLETLAILQRAAPLVSAGSVAAALATSRSEETLGQTPPVTNIGVSTPSPTEASGPTTSEMPDARREVERADRKVS
jgi:hypothetical protein